MLRCFTHVLFMFAVHILAKIKNDPTTNDPLSNALNAQNENSKMQYLSCGHAL